MNSLNQSLADIVTAYTQYDPSNKSYYPKQLSSQELQKLEVQLITLFSQFLTNNGVAENEINKQQKILRGLFHPDKLVIASPEIQWLENSLSTGNNNGICFKLIDSCAEELKQPKINKEDFIFDEDDLSFLHIDELIRKLEQLKQQAVTFTQQALIDSTITLLQTIKRFQSTTDQFEPGWLKTILNSLPYITSGFCITLYLKELSLLYAILSLVAKGGSWLQKGDIYGWRALGEMTREISGVISNAATTLTLYFISMNFSALNTAYYIGFEACSKVFQLIGLSETKQIPSAHANSQALILPQHFLPGKFNFETLELKLITLKLEQYQEQQKQQYFASWRRGCKKSSLIERVFHQLKVIDLKPISISDKLLEVNSIINNLGCHPYFKANKSKARETIEAVKVILEALISNVDKKTKSEKIITEDDDTLIDNLYSLNAP
ncbi:Uncharacterised protein [Legionella busanensis]|uniref:Uncharacterized protein n=1 Tax=Legionella busanensis TaxID=190655 RepID=A0A378JKG1_9GAMM|nr:hypothetical protein [Legionella busanensis]STX50709.1 Uncharacterised protein [Legionella busanensis]